MDLRRFALKIKLTSRMKRVSIDAVQACGMLLREELHLRGTIVSGYCVTNTGEKFVHYWVEDTDGNDYDIAIELAKTSSPELENIEYTRTKNKPYGEIPGDPHNEELFKLYLEEPVKFWKLVQRTY